MAYPTPNITDKNTVTEILLDMIRLGNLSLGASEAHIGEVGGNLSYNGVEFTRPADIIGYTAGDVVCDSVGAPSVISFTPLARKAGGTGYFTKAVLFTNQKTCTSRFRLHLYHVSPTPIADNLPFLLLYADAVRRIGYIDFPAMTTENVANSTAAQSSVFDVRIPYMAGKVFPIIYGILETLDTFVPDSSQKFYAELFSDNN